MRKTEILHCFALAKNVALLFLLFFLALGKVNVFVMLFYSLLLAGFLFSVGLAVVLVRRNAIWLLIGIELMLNAANLNLVVFADAQPEGAKGVSFALFVIVLATAEAAVALALILQVYRHWQTVRLDEIH